MTHIQRRIFYAAMVLLLCAAFAFVGKAYAAPVETEGVQTIEASLESTDGLVGGEDALSDVLSDGGESVLGEVGQTGDYQGESAANLDDQGGLGSQGDGGDTQLPGGATAISDDSSKLEDTAGQGEMETRVPSVASEASESEGSVVARVSDNASEESLQAGSLKTASISDAIADGVYMISSAISDSARMEIGGASSANGAAANIFSNNWSSAQRWYITNLGNGFYKLMNVASGKYLDVAGAKAGNGARVQQYQWNDTKAQHWAIVSTSDGYKLYSEVSPEYVLDLAGANTKDGTAVQLYGSNDTGAQRWSLSKVEPVLPNGVYTATVRASGKALDVSGASVQNGANVQQYSLNNTMAQDFYLSYNAKNGYYTIIGSASGLALDVAGAANSNGANVQMYEPNDSNAQRWAIAKNSDGTFTLYSAVGGRVLDVSGASSVDGANVQTWISNGTNAQRWTFSEARAWSIPEGVYNIVIGVNRSNSLMVSASSRNISANVNTSVTSTSNWAQKWVLAKASDGYYTIRNLNSRMMLDVTGAAVKSGTNVQQYTENGTAAQLWKPELTVGGIVFRSKLDGSIVLDVSGASKSAGANVQVYSSNGTLAQKYSIRSVSAIDSGTTFVIENLASRTVLDVYYASTDNGAVVQLYESNGTNAQKFKAVSKSGAVYYLENINSHKYLDVDTNTKTKLQQWEGQSGADKQWELVLEIQSGTFSIKSMYTNELLDGTSGSLSLQKSNLSDAQKFVLQPIAMTFRLYLDAGHIVGEYGYDSGATGNGYTEAELTSDLTDRIFRICVNEYGLDVVDGKTFGISYEKRTAKAVELGCTAFLSIHFNAGGGSGFMGIVGGPNRRNANSPELADIMHEYLAKGMSGLNDYGVSTRDDLAVTNDGRIASTLLEVAFIDNSYDMEVYNSRRDTVARYIAQGIYEAAMRASFNK